MGHLYLYLRVLRPLLATRRARGLAVGVLTGMTLLLALRRSLRAALPEPALDVYAVGVYVWLALVMSFTVAAVAVDAVALALAVGKRLRARAEPVKVDTARRAVTQLLPLTALGAGAATAGYGSWRALTPPGVNERAVKLARLPKTLEGLSIVQLTDIHVGAFIDRRFVDELVRRTNALKPDLIAITGDLVDGPVHQLGPAVAALGSLRSRFGSYFVTGNHDYASGEVEWSRFLESHGVQVLRNRSVQVGDAGGRINLLGVDDWSGRRRGPGRGGYDLQEAQVGIHPDAPQILLAHQPANFDGAAEQGVDLQISGHTHGGQAFPMTAFIGLAWDYVDGLYQRNDSQIFVSRGCGFWGPPLRLGAPPEIVKLVLTA